MGLGREQGEAIMLLPAWDVAPPSSLSLPRPPNNSNLAHGCCCFSWLCGKRCHDADLSGCAAVTACCRVCPHHMRSHHCSLCPAQGLADHRGEVLR